MTLTEGAIKYNRITGVVLAAIFLFSLAVYQNMPRAEDPDLTFRWAQIATFLPGASPKRVEELVSDKIEKVLKEVPEIEWTSSTSRTGVSLVMFKIWDKYGDLQPIFDDARRKLQRIQPDLPSDVIGPTLNDEFGDVFGIEMMLTGDGFSYAELADVADEVRDELLVLGEVAKVELHGKQEERIFLEYNNARLAEFGLSPGQLTHILANRNIITPGGSITTGTEKLIIEPSGNYETLEDLRRTIIDIPGDRNLTYLGDLAEVKRGYIDPPQTIFHANGIPAISVAIGMGKGGNNILMGEQVRELIAELEKVYPVGIEFDYIAFQPDLVKSRVATFVNNLFQAIGFVSGVMLLFLGLRTGLIVASLVPAAILLCFVIMSLLKIGIDQISLAAMIIALGMLVDSAIVMVESILVEIEEGKTVHQACIDSANELRAPLLIASLTTAAAFLPQFLAESGTGEYTASLFKVVTITLLSAWVLALTMIPLLCVLFLCDKKAADARDNSAKAGEDSLYGTRWYAIYRGFLIWILQNRMIALLIVFGLFFVSAQCFKQVPKIFFPEDDRIYITAEFKLPFGTTIEHTRDVLSDIEAYIDRELKVTDQQPRGIVRHASHIGSGGPRFQLNWKPEANSPEYAFLHINTTDPEIRDEVMLKLQRYALGQFPDLHMKIKKTFYGPPVDAPVAVRLIGPDVAKLYELAGQAEAKLESIPGTKFVKDDWGAWFKKMMVNVDQARARRAGVSSSDISTSLQANFDGLVTTEFREGEDLIPVILRSVGADRRDLGKLETIDVYSQSTGQSVPLKQVADLEIVWEPGKIQRRYGEKTITINSQLHPGKTAVEVVAEIKPWLTEQMQSWPRGYRFEIAGEAADSAKDQQATAAKMPIGMAIILLLLVWQFNSLRRPLIILLTIPLCLIGVFFGLFITSNYFGFMTFLGVVALAGIVINNAIVLIDRIEIEINEYGRSVPDAIIEGSQRRLRPILLTTATTAFGLIPLWYGGGMMWNTMAIAIIFGLVFATVLTLGVVPVLYSLFFRVPFKGYEYAVKPALNQT